MIKSIRKQWRIYFNRHGAAPLMWCVSDVHGTFEICVPRVHIDVPSWFVYRAKESADDDDGRPSGWVECEGVLELSDNGSVCIVGG
jgi:hypothetical protein